MTKKVEDVASDDVVQICMTGTTFSGIVAFLRSRGLTVDPMHVPGDDIPTFTVGISDELMRRANPAGTRP